jgi:hypothetical protein
LADTTLAFTLSKCFGPFAFLPFDGITVTPLSGANLPGEGHLYPLGRDMIAEHPVMLCKQQGRAVFQDQLFDLDAAQHVDVIQRLIPDIEVRLLAQTAGQQDFLLLPRGKITHIFFKLYAGEVQLAQDGFELADGCILRTIQCCFARIMAEIYAICKHNSIVFFRDYFY